MVLRMANTSRLRGNVVLRRNVVLRCSCTIEGPMCPFSVTVQHVPDRELGPLLSQLSRAGFDNPTIDYVGADNAVEEAGDRGRGGSADLPEDWRVVRELKGESYRWPQGRDRYSRYRV